MNKNFSKKLIIATLSASLLLPSSAFAANFTDVNVSDWFYKSVQKLEGNGIVSGYSDGSFKPSSTIKKSEFLKMVMATKDYNLNANYGEHWVTPWLNTAYDKEFLDDFDRQSFSLSRIDEPITRREMAKLIVNINDFSSYDDEDMTAYITDFDSIDLEFKPAVKSAFFSGIITGYPDDTFNPYGTLTRAEACVVIDRMLNKDERVVPTQNMYEKRHSKTVSFSNMHSKNFVFNESNGTSFIYNSKIMELPNQEELKKEESFNYEFIIDVMTEKLKKEKGYDFLITFDPQMSSEAKTVLDEYLKALMPYNHSGVIDMGIENMNAGASSVKTADIDGWKLQFSSSTGEKPLVMIQIKR